MIAFSMAAFVVVALLFGLSYVVATARQRVVDGLREAAPRIKAWGGWILIVVAVWLGALAVFADFFGTIFPV